jgi:hypothetical protein
MTVSAKFATDVVAIEVDVAPGRLDNTYLGVIADWLEDFRKRRDRAQLRFELIGLDPSEQDLLEAEADELKRCCRLLFWLRRAAR